jgi:hypothetical protein
MRPYFLDLNTANFIEHRMASDMNDELRNMQKHVAPVLTHHVVKTYRKWRQADFSSSSFFFFFFFFFFSFYLDPLASSQSELLLL